MKLTAFKEIYKLKTLAINVESEIKITRELLYLISNKFKNMIPLTIKELNVLNNIVSDHYFRFEPEFINNKLPIIIHKLCIGEDIKLSEIKQTLIDLSEKQTRDEQILSMLQGSKKQEPRTV